MIRDEISYEPVRGLPGLGVPMLPSDGGATREGCEGSENVRS